MPRRGLISLLLVSAFALIAAACGGAEDDPVLNEDATVESQDSGDDRDLPATEDQPTSPTVRDVPDTNATTEPADDGATTEVERPSAPGGTTVQPATDATTTPATTADGTYTVQAGDTLGNIAFRFGTTAAVLADLNALTNPDSLTIGQVLVLPGGQAPADEEGATVADPGDGDATDDGDGDAVGDGNDAGDTGDDPPPAPPIAGAGLSPGGIPQPGPGITFDALPTRPTALSDFATTALPWLQDRTSPSEIQDLFIDWSMPPLAQGDRFFLVDTDADGLFSLVAIFTDPNQPQRGPLTDANIVVYDPVPDQPTRWRQAYDHNLANPLAGQDYFVLGVDDVTGDGQRDITYAEVFCGASTCTTVVHVLVRNGDGYRDAATPRIEIATATTFELADLTGDGVADLAVEGGTFASVGAGPPRPFEFLYSGVGGNFIEILRFGLPTTFQIWVIADANSAFNAGDYAAALAAYTQAATDGSLDAFVPGAGPELVALAQLRSAIAQVQLADPTSAAASAQAASAAGGLMGELASAYLGAIIAQPDATLGCAALNDALALRVGEWDAFWEQFGFGIPAFRAEQLCPF
ncbi:MAG: LysM repeat-containing protein [Chloroflexi bacterium]|nr:MAG: LysM repeat-containing protein [Chloroflexota bacterium]